VILVESNVGGQERLSSNRVKNPMKRYFSKAFRILKP
jgi:hypothetical protein